MISTNKRTINFISMVLFSFLISNFVISNDVYSQQTRTMIVCIGDSHFESHSALTWFLQLELGREYRIISAGRRGWTTVAWRRNMHLWRYQTQRGNGVLISLGGNDRTNHIDPVITQANLDYLIQSIPEHIVVRRIIRPSDVQPPLHLGHDRIHLTREGARDYARRLIPLIHEMFNNGPRY